MPTSRPATAAACATDPDTIDGDEIKPLSMPSKDEFNRLAAEAVITGNTTQLNAVLMQGICPDELNDAARPLAALKMTSRVPSTIRKLMREQAKELTACTDVSIALSQYEDYLTRETRVDAPLTSHPTHLSIASAREQLLPALNKSSHDYSEARAHQAKLMLDCLTHLSAQKDSTHKTLIARWILNSISQLNKQRERNDDYLLIGNSKQNKIRLDQHKRTRDIDEDAGFNRGKQDIGTSSALTPIYDPHNESARFNTILINALYSPDGGFFPALIKCKDLKAIGQLHLSHYKRLAVQATTPHTSYEERCAQYASKVEYYKTVKKRRFDSLKNTVIATESAPKKPLAPIYYNVTTLSLDALADAAVDPNHLDTKHKTRLIHLAVKHQQQNSINALCVAGVDLDATDRQGLTPLELAAQEAQLRGVDPAEDPSFQTLVRAKSAEDLTDILQAFMDQVNTHLTTYRESFNTRDNAHPIARWCYQTFGQLEARRAELNELFRAHKKAKDAPHQFDQLLSKIEALAVQSLQHRGWSGESTLHDTLMTMVHTLRKNPRVNAALQGVHKIKATAVANVKSLAQKQRARDESFARVDQANQTRLAALTRELEALSKLAERRNMPTSALTRDVAELRASATTPVSPAPSTPIGSGRSRAQSADSDYARLFRVQADKPRSFTLAPAPAPRRTTMGGATTH